MTSAELPRSTDAHAPLTPSTSRIAAQGLFLFTLYAYLPLPLPGVVLPFGVALIVATIVFFTTNQSPHQEVVRYLILIVLISCIGIFTGPKAGEYFDQRISTTLFFVASLFIASVVYYEFSSWSADALKRFFLYIALIMIIGAFLENNTPLRAISDAFRGAVALKGILYTSDMRDLLDTGIIRPKLFSLEPSILAQAIGISSLLWLMLSVHSRYRFLTFSGLICAGLIAVRSPSLIVFFAAGGAVYFLLQEPGRPRDKIGKRLLITIVATILTIPLVYFIAEQFMAERIAAMLSGHDMSTIARLGLPALLTVDVLRNNPLFGMGLGGKNAIIDSTLNIVLLLGLSSGHLIKSGAIKGLFPIPALEFWATLGLLGGSIVAFLVGRIQKIIAPGDGWVLVTIILLASLTGGYFGGAYFLSACALYAAVCHARRRDFGNDVHQEK